MDTSRFRIITTLDFLQEAECKYENRTLLFIDFVFYEPSRRLLYSSTYAELQNTWASLEPNLLLKLPSDIRQSTRFLFTSRHDGRYFVYGIRTFKYWE